MTYTTFQLFIEKNVLRALLWYFLYFSKGNSVDGSRVFIVQWKFT